VKSFETNTIVPAKAATHKHQRFYFIATFATTMCKASDDTAHGPGSRSRYSLGRDTSSIVVAGLDPAIHHLLPRFILDAGSSQIKSGMTT
jgi:hypothetical protein